MSYDLVVIGSGGAAFSAAIAARGKNKTVAMIRAATKSSWPAVQLSRRTAPSTLSASPPC